MKSEAIRGNRRLLRYAAMLLASVCYIGQPRTSAAVTLGPVFQLAIMSPVNRR